MSTEKEIQEEIFYLTEVILKRLKKIVPLVLNNKEPNFLNRLQISQIKNYAGYIREIIQIKKVEERIEEEIENVN